MINYYNLKKTIHKSVSLFCLLLLFSYSAIAQNLNFTIDTAVDNGTSITETIVNGGDTYVLTVDHQQDVEELDNLGGGDLIFFLGSASSTTPFTLTITRNGSPADFTLNGMDYDALGAGTISITNQNGDFISNPTAYPSGPGAISITSMVNATDITSFNIIPTGVLDLNNFGFHNINVDFATACVPPVGTVVFTSQDCGAGTFLAEVNVTALGGGSPAIFDGTTTTPVATTGVMSFGPYPTGTPVNFTLQHGSDNACDVDLGTISDTCPPPCLSPIGTAILNSQNCVAETFLIDVNVTDLGSGGSPVIFDGTTSTPVTVTGVTTLGPYANGTPINLTLQHGSDITCDLDLGAISDTCSEIIFTIDTAVDDGTDITETIVSGPDTYVLTVSHSGNEELDNLGGGDIIFFHSSTNPLDPHVLSITRNGFATNFTLKGVDYDALTAGTISVTNQDDAEISSPTSYSVGAGAISITNMVNATDISSFNISSPVSGDLNAFGFHNIKVDIIDTCAPAAATAVFASQNCAQQEFLVEINVTDLGNGSPAVFDGTTTTAITVVGSVFLGPYPTGTPVNFTLQHGVDVTCDVDLGSVTDTCPPPPANDECTGAIAVICGETVTGSTDNATDSGSNPSIDVFYSFTDTILQDVTLTLCNSTYDTYIRVFDDCPQTNEIAGNDDTCDVQSTVTFTAQPNVTYYIMIEGYDDDSGDYEMSVACIPNVPAPGNDLCANATGLTLAATATGETTAGATDSTTGEDDDTTCEPYSFKSDVWYTFVAPLSGEVTIETETSGSSTAASIALYPNCGQLDAESLGCMVGDVTGATLAVTGLISGTTYYVRVWSDGIAPVPVPIRNSQRTEGTFNITVSDTATLSITDFDNDTAFSYYPNPVDTMLTLNSKKEISNVSVFNMLGQEVYKKVPNSVNVNVDMSNLQSGAYFVRVTMDNVTKTIRVIKE